MDLVFLRGIKEGETPKGVCAPLWGDTGWWPWGGSCPYPPPSSPQKGRAESFAAVPCQGSSDPDKIQQECDFPGGFVSTGL